uniref:Uncharacterized protein n=1 Tax=Oryza punctata TaxID=4537 RepID=A0A0E0KG92_ORYPU
MFFSRFDPWPVFFRREWKRCWPFLTGFAVTGAIITKMTAGFTEEDLKNSKRNRLKKEQQKTSTERTLNNSKTLTKAYNGRQDDCCQAPKYTTPTAM